MLNNRVYRKYRLEAGMLKRGLLARGHRVRKKNLQGLARWFQYPSLPGQVFNIGVTIIRVIGRWPRIRVLETMVYHRVNGDAFLRYYKKATRGDGRK